MEAARAKAPEETGRSWAAAVAMLTPLYLVVWVMILVSSLLAVQPKNLTGIAFTHLVVGLALIAWTRGRLR
ncbi:MAG: hypothetical protein AMXMBFR34_18840 [Myxococcaceae bacterium]